MNRAKIGFAHADAHFASLTRQKRNVIVLPKNGQNVCFVGTLHQTQVNEQREACSRVAQRHLVFIVMAVAGKRSPRCFNRGGGKSLKQREISEITLRRVVPLRFVKIENVWLRREPVKIAAHQLSIRSEELQAQEVR